MQKKKPSQSELSEWTIYNSWVQLLESQLWAHPLILMSRAVDFAELAPRMKDKWKFFIEGNIKGEIKRHFC